MTIIDGRIRLPEEYRKANLNEHSDFYSQYNEVLDVSQTIGKSTEDLIKEMNQAGIDYGVIHAEYEFGEDARELNQQVSKLVNENNRFKGFGTVQLDHYNPISLVEQAKEAHELGLIGINLQPVFFNVDSLDRRLYPLYSKAHELGLIVSFHTGIHFSTEQTFTQNNPLFIDQIAVDFPGLKMIACHAAWPWTQEILAIARRHPTVYLDFGGMAPKYIAKGGTGWEPIYTTLNNLLANQILYATDWPVMNMERVKKEWSEMGLKEETLEKLFYKNAARLFGFES